MLTIFDFNLRKTTAFKLRTELDIFANVCRVKTMEGLKTRHSNLDFVIIREQTEGEYKEIRNQ